MQFAAVPVTNAFDPLPTSTLIALLQEQSNTCTVRILQLQKNIKAQGSLLVKDILKQGVYLARIQEQL